MGTVTLPSRLKFILNLSFLNLSSLDLRTHPLADRKLKFELKCELILRVLEFLIGATLLIC